MGDVYKLHYADARGLVEPIRILLEVGGANWEDCRFPVSAPAAIPPEVKARFENIHSKYKITQGQFKLELKRGVYKDTPHEIVLPYGQVPVLEVNGEVISQSTAIGRFLAKRFGLVGQNEMEGVKCDEIVDATKDFFVVWIPVFREQDAEKKAEMMKEAMENTKARYMNAFEKVLKANGSGFLVGKSLTWADINVAHFIQNIEIVHQVTLTLEFPAVTSFIERVFNTPKIKEWMERRPVTLF